MSVQLLESLDDESVNATPTTTRKVAIVGGGPSRRRAPYKDETWEIWAFSSKAWRYPRITRWFEIHAMTDLRQQLASKKRGRRRFGTYMRWMRRLDCPVYMQREHPRIPNSVEFPKDDLVEEFGHCFTSTAAFLIALAMYEGCDEIGLWGIDLRGRKYIRQRPAIRYLLGVARQRGIKVHLRRGTPIRIPDTPKPVRTRVLYAYGWRSRYAWWRYRLRRRKSRRGRLKRRR